MCQGTTDSCGITIVVIGLNVERFLPDCIEGIRAARWPQDQLQKLYVDSGSTDRSVQLAREQADWTVLALDDAHPSAGKGRNLGIAHADHPFIQFLDADMILAPEWLEAAYRTLENNDKLAAVFGRTIERYADKNIYNAMRNAIWSMHPEGLSERLPGAAMVRASVIRQCGAYRSDLSRWEDTELGQRLRAAGYDLLGRPETMCLHDSDMGSFAQYWRSNVRAGLGNQQMLQNVSGKARLFFLRELRRSTMWPILIVMSLPCAAVLHYRWPAFVVCLGFVAAMMRELRRGWRTAGSFRGGFFWCANWTLSKVPYSVGFLLALLPKKAGS